MAKPLRRVVAYAILRGRSAGSSTGSNLMEHRVAYKVYYEDTDCLGIVYYANYLKFMERGRTEFLAARGKSVADWNREGYLLVVRSVQATYRLAATLGDMLDV